MATAASYSGDEQSSFMGEDQHHEFTDKPIYLLEHLATFTVNKESGILYPADGMRRLLQLEKTTGIWSQKMQICLDRQWVLIIDFETGVSRHSTVKIYLFGILSIQLIGPILISFFYFFQFVEYN